MKLWENCCKKPYVLLILMVGVTFLAAFLLGILWEHKSALRNAGERIIEMCGLDPHKIKQSIDQKIIEHNNSFYADDTLLTVGTGIVNLSIIPGQKLSLPITITGIADSGAWFFEGTFPVMIIDNNGQTIIQTFADAQGEWMTTGPVAFKAVLKKSNYIGPATIIFTQNDPSDGESGKPVKEFRIPVVIQ